MPKIQVETAFVLTHDDSTKQHFHVGEHDVDDKIANHFFVKGHVVGAKPNPSAGSPDFIRSQNEAKLAEERRLKSEEEQIERELLAEERAKEQKKLREETDRAQREQAAVAVDVENKKSGAKA